MVGRRVRVRQFTQDDAHLYLRPEQIQAEITDLLELVREQLTARYDVREVVVVRKPSASRVAEPDVLDRLARECDAVVTAIGD